MRAAHQAKLLLYPQRAGSTMNRLGVGNTLLWYAIGYAVWTDFAAWQAVASIARRDYHRRSWRWLDCDFLACCPGNLE